MTIAKQQHFSVPNSVQAATRSNRSTQPHTYERILVFLDGSSAAERAIPEAVNLARPNNAHVVMIVRDHAGAETYINGKAGELRGQHVDAHGYVISSTAAQTPAWLVESEKADAVVIAHKPVSRLGRWLGGDAAAALRARTKADIYDIEV